MTTRGSALQDLISFSKSVNLLAAALNEFAWDFDGSPATIGREHLARVIERYIEGRLTAREIEEWANLVEGREDIDFEAGYERIVGECVYELANPLLTQRLSPPRAQELILLLRHAK